MVVRFLIGWRLKPLVVRGIECHFVERPAIEMDGGQMLLDGQLIAQPVQHEIVLRLPVFRVLLRFDGSGAPDLSLFLRCHESFPRCAMC
jgi:hypothetical protein